MNDLSRKKLSRKAEIGRLLYDRWRAAEQWLEPVPFITPLCGFPMHDVPGFLGEQIRAVAKATETPAELAATMGLAITSACIADVFVVEPEPGYREPVNLYLAAAMESGNRKSAVHQKMVQPLLEWEKAEARKMAPGIAEAERERKTAELRIEVLRKKAASAKDPTELKNEIRAVEEQMPDVPSSRRLWTQDVTPEKLGVLMAENGETLGIFSDEGGIFDLLQGRYTRGQPNLDLFLMAHAASPYRVDRGCRPSVFMESPKLAVGLLPQPSVLQALGKNPVLRRRGLIARFLYWLPPSRLGKRSLEPISVPPEVEREYRDGIFRLLDLKARKYEDGSPLHILTFSPEAYERWKHFQRSVETRMSDGENLADFRDWASKLAGQTARLAAVMHCVAPGFSVSRLQIDANTVEASIRLAETFIAHALVVFELMEMDREVEHAKAVINWIIKLDKAAFTGRECFCALQKRFQRMEALRPVLQMLTANHYIRPKERENSQHRPSEQYVVNPRVCPFRTVTQSVTM